MQLVNDGRIKVGSERNVESPNFVSRNGDC